MGVKRHPGLFPTEVPATAEPEEEGKIQGGEKRKGLTLVGTCLRSWRGGGWGVQGRISR